MKTEQLYPQPAERVRFDRSVYKAVPNVSGCYVLATFDGSILYIGKTEVFARRFQEHLDTSEKTVPTQEGKAFWFYFLEWDKANAGCLENSWLEEFERLEGSLPILNKIHSPG